MYKGFIKVAAAVPTVKVADCRYNTEHTENLMLQADGQGVEIVCFPELGLTAYTCQDLFLQQMLLEEAETALLKLMELSRNLSVTTIVGLPVQHNGRLFNCAAVIQRGKIHGIVPKTFIPNHGEFCEARWFTPAPALQDAVLRFCGQSVPLSSALLFDTGHCTFGIEIGEDLWSVTPPSNSLALEGAEIIFHLSANSEAAGKESYLRSLVQGQSARLMSGYVCAGCGFGESTQDLVFGGQSYIAENGRIIAENSRFAMKDQLIVSEIDLDVLRMKRRCNTSFSAASVGRSDLRRIELDAVDFPAERFSLTRSIDPMPFVPQGSALDLRCREILSIQSQALAKRLLHTRAQTAVLGISGGLDSTLALLVCVHTFDLLGLDRKGIVGITMPGFGTTDRTYTNAVNLMKSLGITIREISIRQVCTVHFNDLGHPLDLHDVTYENGQARERTQILMDAANQMNGLVIGTGDLSELALGWATYNGDHMSMYGLNASVPKTLIRHMVRWMANNIVDEYSRSTLLDIVDTPISPELIPADAEGNITQKTEDLVGPYELHDFFLYHLLRHGYRPAKIHMLACHAFNGEQGLRHDAETIKKWLMVFFRRFFAQQFKRSCLPDGPRVGSCSLSPRGDWHMSSDAEAEAWLEECRNL